MSRSQQPIVVVGSINIDLVSKAERIPVLERPFSLPSSEHIWAERAQTRHRHCTAWVPGAHDRQSRG